MKNMMMCSYVQQYQIKIDEYQQGMADNNTIIIEEEKRASKKSENIEDTVFH